MPRNLRNHELSVVCCWRRGRHHCCCLCTVLLTNFFLNDSHFSFSYNCLSCLFGWSYSLHILIQICIVLILRLIPRSLWQICSNLWTFSVTLGFIWTWFIWDSCYIDLICYPDTYFILFAKCQMSSGPHWPIFNPKIKKMGSKHWTLMWSFMVACKR